MRNLTNEAILVGKKIIDFLPKLSLVTAGIGLCLMTILIIAEVIARSLFRYSFPFAIEYSEYLIPMVALWGAAYVLKEDGHVRADIVTSYFRENTRLWFDLVGSLMGLVFLITLDIQTIALVAKSLRFKYTSLYPLRTPLGYVQLVLPIGLSLFSMQLVVEIVKKTKMLQTNYKKRVKIVR